MADDEIEFLAVPGGLVILRDSRRDRVREVRLQPFRMARTPVIVRQFASSASKETVDASLAADLPQSPRHLARRSPLVQSSLVGRGPAPRLPR